MYKLTLALLLTFNFSLLTTFGQSPEKVSYQAVVRDASDNLVSNTQVGMQISILQNSATVTAVYVETQTPTTNANGLVSIEIGNGTVVSGDFATIDWANDSFFIKTETDPAGGTSYSITATSQLLSVPYALHAKTAETVTGGITETDPTFTSSQAANITATDITNLSNLSGVNTGDQDLSSYATKDMGNAKITNLATPTEDKDAATKAYVDLLESRIDALETQMILNEGVTDIDGNTYEVVKIGTQIWMAENLKVTHYPNGDAIPLVTDNTAWGNLADNNTDDAMCYFNNNSGGEADTYGALYTYAAAIGDDWARDNTADQGVCPDGWHLPSDAEWTTLENYLGADAGSKLAGNAALWTNGALDQNPNFGTSGFSALPGGYRDCNDGSFYNLGSFGYWWSSTQYDSGDAYRRYLGYSDSTLTRNVRSKSNGYSVRCVRD